MVRCPVCESQAVTIVLNSKPHASCSACGATWIQEGSWQRAIRPGQSKLPVVGVVANANGNGANGRRLDPVVSLDDDVVALPDPATRARTRSPAAAAAAPADEEAIAT